MKTWRVLSALLAYPEPWLVRGLEECRATLDSEKLLGRANRNAIEQLINHLADTPLIQLQSSYVDWFDRTPANSLHLFEHIYGDNRARGQALADLSDTYARQGLAISSNETPDYLPLFLEYLSLLKPKQTQASLGVVVDLLETLRLRLHKRSSPYQAVFAALLELARLKPDSSKVQAALRLDDGSLPQVARVEASWEEAPAFSCSTCDSGDSCTSQQEHTL